MANFNPLDHPIWSSYPLRILATAELAHVPFAMSLIDIARPRTIVEIGTREGVLYSALCQAVRELRLDSRCHSISDSGASIVSDNAPFAEWKTWHDRLYSTFSQLHLKQTNEALDLFSDSSIDLLHVNGDYGCKRSSNALRWLPKMSSKGIVIISDTNTGYGASETWKLWTELQTKYPSFELAHGGGLGIVATGSDVPDAFESLLQAREPELSVVREFFRQQARRLSLSINNGHALPGNGSSAGTTERESELLRVELLARTKEVEQRKQAYNSAISELQTTQSALEVSRERLEHTSERLEYTSDRLEDTSRRLEAILNSRAWRWVTRYGRIKNRLRGTPLLPPPENLVVEFRAGLDFGISNPITVGKGTALYISGWCYHTLQKVKNIQLLVGDTKHQVKAARMPRQDLLDDHFPHLDPAGNSYRSGFWAILPIPQISEPSDVAFVLEVTLTDGTVCREQLDVLSLRPGSENPKRLVMSEPELAGREPLVAICMTTFNPRLDLFTRQIESIINQTHTNWVCVISDDNSQPEILEHIKTVAGHDPRFHVFPGSGRLGFYHNFERSISLAPAEAEFIALSDQDDYWHPDKLETLLAEFDEDTTLVYSDMNIVSDEGIELAKTYWTTRPNNYENFASLLMANTVTGAASIFHKRLLPYVLPFPQKVGSPYHDHWIACAAMATGKIGYVDRPLYDYVQHSTNALGHFAPARKNLPQRVRDGLLASLNARSWVRATLANGKIVYFYDLIREQVLCKVLELRCAAELTPSKKRSLRLIGDVDDSLLAFGWMATRGLKDGGRRRETLGAEKVFMLATVWKKYTDLRQRLGDGAVRRKRLRTQPAGVLTTGTTSEAEGRNKVPPVGQTFPQVQLVTQKIAPLSLKGSPTAPLRVNLLIPYIDLQHFFGGYITKLNLARRLSEAGLNVRIVIVDICDFLPSVWQRQLQSYDGLNGLFDRVELVYAYDRTKLLEVSSDDVFIATTWWTAHIAHEAAKAMQKSRFIYLIQEYEPFTFPMGSFSSLAEKTYSFPHYAIFSTELLRDYFRQNAIGVFANGAAGGEINSISFQNCITSVGDVKPEDIANRTPKKLLFYARPEQHAARNMFELATVALANAIRKGYFSGDWEFFGIGSVGTTTSVELQPGIQMTLFPRQDQEAYRHLLRQHDLGLSLMYTPHPSLVPIEMAAAGMLVVTNTYANKTVEQLQAISSNILAVEPTIEDVTLGLKRAAAQVDDYDARVKGAEVHWSTTWQESFNETFIERVSDFIERARS